MSGDVSQLLPAGTICFAPTGVPGKGFYVGSTGQATGQPACRDVTAGVITTLRNGVVIGPLEVADTSLSSPANLCYVVTVRDANGNIVLGGNAPYSGYGCVQPSGATFNFDAYIPNEPVVALGQSITNLSVEYLTVANCTGCSTQPSGSGNEIYATPANGSSGPAGLRAMVAADVPALPESAITNLPSDLAAKLSAALTSAYFFVGNASNVATGVAMSGDCGLSNAGAITCTKTGGVAFGSLATLSTVTSSQVDSSICSNASCTQNTSGTAAGLSANIPESKVTNLGTDLAAKAVGLGSSAQYALPIFADAAGKNLSQTVGSGYSTTFPSSGTGFQQMAQAPQNTFVSDNANWGYGIDTAVGPRYRDFVLAYIQEGLPGLTPSDFDFIYLQYNASYTTLSSSLTVGATSIPLTAALTMGVAMGAHQYVRIGGVSTSDQQMCIVTAGSGTTTLTVSNCYSVATATVSGSAFANPSGENVTVLNDLANNSPSANFGGDAGDPLAVVNVLTQSNVQANKSGINVYQGLGSTGNDFFKAIVNYNWTANTVPSVGFQIDSQAGVTIRSSETSYTVTDGVANGTTTITSATAAWDYKSPGMIVTGTDLTPNPETYITAVSGCDVNGRNCTTATINQVASGSASGLTWVIWGGVFRVQNVGGNPFMAIYNTANGLTHFTGGIYVGRGCPNSTALSDAQVELCATGTGNASLFLNTQSDGSLQIIAKGSAANVTMYTPNSSTLYLGTAATPAIEMDTSQNTALMAHLNQGAASTIGGTCTMASGTTCTITLAHAYTTPVCIATEQSNSSTVIAANCSVSSTTVTVTAASSNSATWGAFVFGNPN
ncbi:hypothetical protein [Mycobacterium sp.]|uniref:hypothetical protein n=1 Tax=Mycobacterium sp. TaxID=1785 RepID=UPI003F9CCFE9